MTDAFLADLAAFASVIVIDLVLAGDNAVVIGMAAGRLEPHLRPRAIAIGIVLAIVFRIVFAVFAVGLMEIVGILLLGGALLLWVAWKMWRDLHREAAALMVAETAGGVQAVAAVGFGAAIFQIAVADISMSLDNVLAVAGAARHNVWAMGLGLMFSIALMGVAATFIARLLDRFRWLNYAGLVVVVLVALLMIADGAKDIYELV